MNTEHFECYALTAGGDDNGFVDIDHSFHEGTPALRHAEIEESH